MEKKEASFLSEQEMYTKILEKMIAKTENDSIQTSEQLIQALIVEMSANEDVFEYVYETNHA